MNEEKHIDIEDLVETIGLDFLDFLKDQKVLPESFVSRTKSRAIIECTKSVDEMITEAKDTPATHNKNGIVTPTDEILVPYDKFHSVWTNYTDYPDYFSILEAFGVLRSKVQGLKQDSISHRIRRMLAAYESGRSIGWHSNPRLVKFGQRKATYGKVAQTDSNVPDPTTSDIIGGSRTRKTQTTVALDRINAQELLSGEFYANRTRIPKQRWASFIRFWDRRKSSVRPNPKRANTEWKKYFLMGYQIDKHILFEIWYNTYDSTFMIHDHNGAELGRPVATLQEALRYFVTQITTASEQDSEIFTGGGVDNQVANSMMRGIASQLSKDSSISRREAELAKLSAADLKGERRVKRMVSLSAAKQEQQTKEFNDRLKKSAKETVKNLGGKQLASLYTKAKAVPSNLQRAAYVQMMNTSTTVDEKVSVALKAAFEYAIKQSEKGKKDIREFEGVMVSDLLRSLNDVVERRTDIVKMAKEFIDDAEVRAEITKRLLGEDAEEEERKREDVRRRVKDAEAKFREDLEKKRKEQMDKASAERDRQEAKGKKSLGDKYDVLDRRRKKLQSGEDELDIARSNKSNRELIQKYMKELGGDGKQVNEQVDPDEMDSAEAAQNLIDVELSGPQMDQQVRSVRNMAEKSPWTQAALASAVMADLLKTYDRTRSDKELGKSRLLDVFKRSWFKGKRREVPVVLPTDPAPFWDRMRQTIYGKRTRADFIIGYTLDDKVNIEIWYITEWDYSANKPISSFHVFDVSSATVVRRYLPYYRNAVTVALAKIGLTV